MGQRLVPNEGSLPEHWLNKTELVELSLRQAEKDFALQGIKIAIERNAETYADLLGNFAILLDEIGFAHNPKMPSVLYQLDLRESEISKKATEAQPGDLHRVLAEEILKKCFEKVMWRKKLGSS